MAQIKVNGSTVEITKISRKGEARTVTETTVETAEQWREIATCEAGVKLAAFMTRENAARTGARAGTKLAKSIVGDLDLADLRARYAPKA